MFFYSEIKGHDRAMIGNKYLARRHERFFATILDGLFIAIPAAIIKESGEFDDTRVTAIFWIVILYILYIMIVQMYYLTTQGQTIGKKWLKIQIVDAKTQKAGGFLKTFYCE